MSLNFDSSMFYYLIVIAFLFVLIISMKLKNLLIFRLILKTAIGGVFIFILNLVLNSFGFSIPLNLITSFFMGVLGLPGLALILLIKYVIYPL
ncbi:inhibitor of the pro-sigma K processing machinery [Caloramator fervidus]|uniref:Inhibitor of the pro-sigma K processing machinery n=1 Tax=Caloramator fervidus TaxID=29344 RepID=A0A1H5WUW6_9CLOT|nr:pro-sigmaK processing inhibitor BofA family protein [Caloramator fervidus]SEG03095.1 inhibitor of the pro-sigma K processing machinery [Caloramator fervidus]